MSSLNKCCLIGRLGEDPTIRTTQSNTKVANFSLATSERFTDKNGQKQEETTWHRITAWGRLAEICEEYLKKGALVFIEGPITTRTWEDKNGEKRYSTEIKALNMQMLDTKGDSGGHRSGSSGSGRSQRQSEPAKEPDLTGLDDDMSDLPF